MAINAVVVFPAATAAELIANFILADHIIMSISADLRPISALLLVLFLATAVHGKESYTNTKFNEVALKISFTPLLLQRHVWRSLKIGSISLVYLNFFVFSALKLHLNITFRAFLLEEKTECCPVCSGAI